MVKVRQLSPLIAMLFISSCATPERVVLLPAGSSKATAIVVSGKSGNVTLARPYAEAVIGAQAITVGQIDAETVTKRYGGVIAAIPATPKIFLVYFTTGSNELTAESVQLIGTIQGELGRLPAPEVIVIGHTDRVGTLESNDALSAKRAEFIRDKLIAIGVPAARIESSGRGEREPLVPTDDEVAEPRNRRVEIKIR